MPAAGPQQGRQKGRRRWWLSPVVDRGGRFSPFKSVVLAALLIPATWLAGRYLAGGLGARPVLALVHGTGLWTLRLVLIALTLTPARRVLDWPRLVLIRRMIGVAAAAYGLLHLTLFCVQQNGALIHVASEIVHRLYLAIGFVALAGLTALAATSTDGAMKRLGRGWKRLHRLIYPAAALGLLHFFMQAKAEVFQAVILAGLFAWLMAWRALPAGWRARALGLFGLGLFAAAAAAGLEYAWFALATHVQAGRVFAANFQFVHWRPSAYVGVWCAGAMLASLLARQPFGSILNKVTARSVRSSSSRDVGTV